MSDYTKELEAQIEALKVALDNERDKLDFTSRREKSKKNRIWNLKFIANMPQETPKNITSSIPLQFLYNDAMFHSLDDMRYAILYTLDGYFEYYGLFLKDKKLHNNMIDIVMTVELFDRNKQLIRFQCILAMHFTVIIDNNKPCYKLYVLNSFEPHTIREVDEIIIPYISPDCEYIKKWGEHYKWNHMKEKPMTKDLSI